MGTVIVLNFIDKDGTFLWENLKDLKEYNPMSVIDYFIADIFSSETALYWWMVIY